MECKHEKINPTEVRGVFQCTCGAIITAEDLLAYRHKYEEVAAELEEVRAYMKQIQIVNSNMDKENELLRACLKVVL